MKFTMCQRANYYEVYKLNDKSQTKLTADLSTDFTWQLNGSVGSDETSYTCTVQSILNGKYLDLSGNELALNTGKNKIKFNYLLEDKWSASSGTRYLYNNLEIINNAFGIENTSTISADNKIMLFRYLSDETEVSNPYAGEYEHDGVSIVPNKQIDSFRDGEENNDTTLNNISTNLEDLSRLYLTFGPTAALKPIDLVIVAYVSGSMKLDDKKDMTIGDKTNQYRIDGLKWVLNGTTENKLLGNGLIKKFLALNPENYYSIVTFSSKDYGSSSDNRNVIFQDWTNSPEKAFTANPEGGTNYVIGLNEAYEQFNKLSENHSHDNHQKVMIFLSDGEPKFHYSVNNDQNSSTNKKLNITNTKEYGVGNSDNYKDSDPNSEKNYKRADSLGVNSTAAMNYYDLLRERFPDLIAYTINISNSDSFASTLSYMTSEREAYNFNNSVRYKSDNYLQATNTQTIYDAMINMITGSAGYFTDIALSDTLSDYVDFYESNTPTDSKALDIKMTIEKSDGSVETLYEGGHIVNGKFYPGQLTEMGKEMLEDIEVDVKNKTITAIFVSTYKMQGYKYSPSFNVVTTHAAKKIYTDNIENGRNGYVVSDGVHTGAENSDYDSNKTSSFEEGFYSNASASVIYRRQGFDGTEAYDIPVVQVTQGIYIQKAWDSSVHNKNRKPVTVTLYEISNITNEAVAADTLTLSDLNSWIGIFSSLPIKSDYHYGIAEADAEKNEYIVSYTDITDNRNTSINTAKVNLITCNENHIHNDACYSEIDVVPVDIGESISVKIYNKMELILPETGGISAAILTIAGALTVIVTVAFFIRSRKRKI